MSKHEKAVFNTLARELTTHFAVANALVDDIAVRCSSATLGGVPPPPPSVAHGGAPPPLWQVRLLPSVGVDASLDLDSVNVQVVMPPHTPTTPPTRKRHAPRRCTPSLVCATHSSPVSVSSRPFSIFQTCRRTASRLPTPRRQRRRRRWRRPRRRPRRRRAAASAVRARPSRRRRCWA